MRRTPIVYLAGGIAGKDLLCWCAPLPCHGDVLLRIANVNATESRGANG